VRSGAIAGSVAQILKKETNVVNPRRVPADEKAALSLSPAQDRRGPLRRKPIPAAAFPLLVS